MAEPREAIGPIYGSPTKAETVKAGLRYQPYTFWKRQYVIVVGAHIQKFLRNYPHWKYKLS